MLLAGLSTATASASDWSIFGQVTEQVEADTNRTLAEDGKPIYGSTTGGNVTISLDDKSFQWVTDLGLNGLYFVGPGDTTGLRRVDPNLATAVSYQRPRLILDGAASFDVQPTAFTQVQDTGITDEGAAQLTTLATGSATFLLNSRNQAVVSASTQIVRFTDDAVSLIATDYYGLAAGWDHEVNGATESSLNVGISRFTADNPQDAHSLVFDVGGGLGYQVNERLSFSSSVGFNVVQTTQTFDNERGSDLSIGFVGDATVSWEPRDDTQLAFDFGQELAPSSLGQLQNVTGMGVGVFHQIDPRMDVEVRSSYARRAATAGFSSDGDNRQIFSLSPSFGFNITREWRTELGYTLDLNRFEESDLTSNQIFYLSLTRSFSLLP